MVILLGIKNLPYTAIFGLVGVSVGKIEWQLQAEINGHFSSFRRSVFFVIIEIGLGSGFEIFRFSQIGIRELP